MKFRFYVVKQNMMSSFVLKELFDILENTRISFLYKS